jgi:predicted phage terminase large subunit-like protein
MMSPWYQRLFPTRISPLQRAADDFATIQGGTRMATSVGGTLTGRGGDIIIIDDAMKPDDALSEVRRAAANEWFDNTLQSRLNNKEYGAIVIIMQRLHQDDLVGQSWNKSNGTYCRCRRLLRKMRSLFSTTYLAAVSLPAKPALRFIPSVSRSLATVLFANRWVNTISKANTSRIRCPRGGTMVKTSWLQYYRPADLPKRFSTIVQSWDTANKISELNDYSVCTTWGYIDDKFYLPDVLRRRLNYPDLKRAAWEQKEKHRPGAIIIEDKASGTQLIQDLQADHLFNVKGIEHLPGTDKVMRLHTKTMLFENGAVLLPKQAPWLEEYIKELTGFPGARFDDQVDSTTQALEYLRGPGREIDIWYRAAGIKRR